MTPEQLNASILQRAMEGKLVPQDPNDEPASELFKRIKAEKEKLIAEGKIKRDKKETEFFRGEDGKPYEKLADGTIQEVEVPYDIPESWEWVRLRNLGVITSGGTPKSSEPAYYGGNIIWITPADMGKQQNDKLFTTSSKKITELGLKKSSAQLISKNSIVYSSRAPIGHINIVSYDFTTNQGCKSITPILVNLDFMYWMLRFRTKDIILRSSGTTFKEISASDFGSTLIPLPPLAEQKRIVDQIERTLEKVDEYTESYNKLQDLDKTFPDQLKKSILQYAMQGKLVAQDPNDEPVEVLLEKIKAEKQKLFEEGKLKKKDLEEMVVVTGDDNSPYQDVTYTIPESWTWKRLGTMIILTSGQDLKSTEYVDGKIIGLPYLTGASNFQNGQIVTDRYTDKPSVISTKGELLITVKGTIGEMAFNHFEQAHIARQIMSIQSINLNIYFLKYLLTYSLSRLKQQAQSMIPGISRDNLLNILTPLPPLAEQERIVSKISQIFSVVEILV
ncbi:restriction endonuclease subunit S [Aerococcaceae bacterium zg-B36]|uniref:restriction endonuclease subunit S n=1 Tax=Aerococcaceae bacterium zg-252 TaxID=2796928 RepID=UPI001BD8B22C|nr:restriction endonuclease subunit S [Aerococcaceae bacterium zg-B36]